MRTSRGGPNLQNAYNPKSAEPASKVKLACTGRGATFKQQGLPGVGAKYNTEDGDMRKIWVAFLPGFLTIESLLIGGVRLLGGDTSAGVAGRADSMAAALTAALGVEFVKGSTSTVVLERDGKRYIVDLVAHTIREAEPRSAGSG